MKYYIKQIGTKDCGITCLKMLFAIIKNDENCLYYHQDKINESYTLMELINIAKEEGVILRGYKLENKNELYNDIRIPSIITINKNDALHTVLIKKKKHNKFLIYDPSEGVYWEKNESLIKYFNGEVIEVVSYTTKKLKYNKDNVRIKPKILLSFIFQIFSITSLIISLSIVQNKNNFYISLVLFFLYIIFEIIYKKMLIFSMKNFDKTMYKNIFSHTKISKEKTEIINRYKISKFNLPIAICSDVIILSFLIIVLGINSLYNLLVCGVISIIIFIFKLNEFNKINREKRTLNYLENSLLNENKIVSKQDFLEYNNKAYALSEKINVQNYVIVFLIFVLSLLYSYFSKNLSINFVLFYFFMYSTFYEYLNKMFKIEEEIEKYKQNKALYLYFCNK